MPNSKYNLQSKDVQEIMSSRISYIITWGNSIVFVLTIIAAIMCNKIMLTQQIELPFKIDSISYNGDSQKSFLINLSINAEIPKSVKTNQKVTITIDAFNTCHLGNLTAKAVKVDPNFNKITCEIRSVTQNKIMTDKSKIVLPNVGMLGLVRINIGKQSILHSFFTKAQYK